MKRPRYGWALLLLVFQIIACDKTISNYERRAQYAARGKGDIVIAAVSSSGTTNHFKAGVDLAQAEINQAGGVLGRKIRILHADDYGNTDTGRRIAKKLVKNRQVTGVVGHAFSSVAIPVAITYNLNGLPFISTGATHPFLTGQNLQFVFRNIPSDIEIGRQAAAFIKQAGHQSAVILYERNSVSKRLAEIFAENAKKRDIAIAAMRSFFDWQTDFQPLLAEIKSSARFDCIFLAGLLPTGAYLINQARAMGISVPIVSGDGLDSPDLLSLSGKAAEDLSVATTVNPSVPLLDTQKFIQNFIDHYGFEPDNAAAQGYDAIKVLAFAMHKAESTVPIVVASTMHFLKNYPGVTGSYDFTPSGDITGKPLYFKTVKNGIFTYPEVVPKQKPQLFEYVKNLTVRLPIDRDVCSLDPGLCTDMLATEIINQLFAGLTVLRPETYTAMPYLATGWDCTPDKKTYTFHLRQDAHWSNGRPISAHDVEWTIKRNLAPETGATAVSLLYHLKNAQAIRAGRMEMTRLGVKAVDDTTIIFRLERPIPFFPEILSHPVYRPLPRNIVEAYGRDWTDVEHIQGSGPYRLARWSKGLGIVLVKNRDFFDAVNVNIPQVRYFIIRQSAIGAAMYENNQLDLIGSGFLDISEDLRERILTNPSIRSEEIQAPEFCTSAVVFDTAAPPVDNPLVRKAIAAAINRPLIGALLGISRIATTFTCPSLSGAPESDENAGIRFNPQNAKRWLEKAGYSQGNDLPELTLLHQNTETHRQYAQALQASLSQYLGIRITLKVVPPGEYENAIHSGNSHFHMFLMKWFADYPDANNFMNDVFNPRNPFFQTHWKNEEYVSLMEKGLEEKEDAKRRAIYERAEQILCREAVVTIPLFYEQAHILVNRRIDGYYPMAIGGQQIRNWKIDE